MIKCEIVKTEGCGMDVRTQLMGSGNIILNELKAIVSAIFEDAGGGMSPGQAKIQILGVVNDALDECIEGAGEGLEGGRT